MGHDGLPSVCELRQVHPLTATPADHDDPSQAQHAALRAGRQREHTEAFTTEYAKLAGVEGTIAQGVRSCELRRSRYIGVARTHLQHLMTAAAMNVVRMLHWLAEIPKATPRASPFVRLYQAAA